MKLGEAIYKAQAEAEEAAEEADEPAPVDEDIVDADFEDIEDDKKASSPVTSPDLSPVSAQARTRAGRLQRVPGPPSDNSNGESATTTTCSGWTKGASAATR